MSRESLPCVGEDVYDMEEAEDLDECPRDHTETVGDGADDTDEVCT